MPLMLTGDDKAMIAAREVIPQAEGMLIVVSRGIDTLLIDVMRQRRDSVPCSDGNRDQKFLQDASKLLR
jgi:hypothetical protein